MSLGTEIDNGNAAMPKIAQSFTVTIPEGLRADLERLCTDLNVAPNELALDVLSEYIETQRRERWETFFAYGYERGRASGYGPEDVPRLLEEVRGEMAAEQAARE